MVHPDILDPGKKKKIPGEMKLKKMNAFYQDLKKPKKECNFIKIEIRSTKI